MGVKQTLSRSSLSFSAYLIGSAINLLASYTLMVFLLNVLSKTEYGEYGFWVSLFSMLLIVFNFGHKEAVFKQASVNKGEVNQGQLPLLFGNFYRWNALLLLTVQSLILFDITLYWVAMAFLLNSWVMTFAGCHRGCEHYVQDALALPLQRLLWLLISLACYFIFGRFNLSLLFISSLIASIVCVLWLYLPLRPSLSFSLLSKQWLAKPQWLLLINFVVIEIASVFYLKSDVLLLRYFGFELAVMADYFFAIQVFEIAVLVLMPVGYFYFNRVNQLGIGQHVSVWPALIRLMALVIVMQTAVWLLAPITFPLWVPKYTDSISTIVLVMFSLYPVAVNILLSSLLIAHSKEQLYAKICLIALLFNLVANFIFIPMLALDGAIWVKFFTELVITIALVVVVRKILSRQSGVAINE